MYILRITYIYIYIIYQIYLFDIYYMINTQFYLFDMTSCENLLKMDRQTLYS